MVSLRRGSQPRLQSRSSICARGPPPARELTGARARARGAGLPAVLECYPLVPQKGAPGCAPFPTLFWLSHAGIKAQVSPSLPLSSKVCLALVIERVVVRWQVSELEFLGMIEEFKGRLLADPAAMAKMQAAHSTYAAERAALLSPGDAALADARGWGAKLRAVGVGGMRADGCPPPLVLSGHAASLTPY
jgi:hypothetical protein